MYSVGQYIIIEDIISFSPNMKDIDFTDKSGAKFTLQNKDIIRLRDGLKFSIEKCGQNFKKYSDKLFEDENNEQ